MRRLNTNNSSLEPRALATPMAFNYRERSIRRCFALRLDNDGARLLSAVILAIALAAAAVEPYIRDDASVAASADKSREGRRR